MTDFFKSTLGQTPLMSCQFKRPLEEELSRLDFHPPLTMESWESMKLHHLGMRAVRLFYHAKFIRSDVTNFPEKDLHLSGTHMPLAKSLRQEYSRSINIERELQTYLYEEQVPSEGEMESIFQEAEGNIPSGSRVEEIETDWHSAEDLGRVDPPERDDQKSSMDASNPIKAINFGCTGLPQHKVFTAGGAGWWPGYYLEPIFYLEKAGVHITPFFSTPEKNKLAVTALWREFGVSVGDLELKSFPVSKKSQQNIQSEIVQTLYPEEAKVAPKRKTRRKGLPKKRPEL